MKHGDFLKQNPQRLSDGSLSQEIDYCLGDEVLTYVATGDDHLDLSRDWAFKYLELFN